MPAVGSVVVTKTRLQRNLYSISIAWTAGTGGSAGVVSGNPVAVGSGALQQVIITPGGAPDAPTDHYTCAVKDAGGNDMIVGKGADCRAASSTIGVDAAPLSWLAGGTLDVVIGSAGAGKKGTVLLIVQRV
jgi:hypothetical protein